MLALVKSLLRLEAVQQTKDLFEVTDREAVGYTVQAGQSLNPRNGEYPDRLLLLRHLQDDKFVVIDFGDFAPYHTSSLLRMFKVRSNYIDPYAEAIYALIADVNRWLEVTGGEFLIDTKRFRIGISGQDSPDQKL